MIEGIEILNQTTIVPMAGICDWWPLFLILMVAAFIMVFAFLDSDSLIGFLVSFILTIGFLIMTVLCTAGAFKNQAEAYQQYQVKISDSVSFSEFESKYNIIAQEGKIYTITEKDEVK